MRLDLRNQKGISFMQLVIIIGVVLFLLYIMGSFSDYKLNVSNNEVVSYTTLRYTISKSRVDGTGTMTKSDFENLGRIAKNQNSSNEWFSDNWGIFYGKNMDTSEYEITMITDGNYCATFKVRLTGNDRYLVEYTFEKKEEKGYRFFVEN